MCEVAAYACPVCQHIASRRRGRGRPDAVGDVGADPRANRLHLRIARSDIAELTAGQGEQLLDLAIPARKDVRDHFRLDRSEWDPLRGGIDHRCVDIDYGKIAHAKAPWGSVNPQETIGAARVVELFDRYARLRRDRLAADALARCGRHGDIEDEKRLLGDVVLQLTID